MSDAVKWLDEELHIYQVTLPESLDNAQERSDFLDEMYQFNMAGPDTQYALIDMTHFDGHLIGLTDPKLMRQRDTRAKTRAVAILTSSSSVQIMANTVQVVMFPRMEWKFFKHRNEALAYLKGCAQADRGMKE